MAMAPLLSTRTVNGRVVDCPYCSSSTRQKCCTCNGLGKVRELLRVVGVGYTTKAMADKAKKRDKEEYDEIMKNSKIRRKGRF